jgi:hypothetical protein
MENSGSSCRVNTLALIAAVDGRRRERELSWSGTPDESQPFLSIEDYAALVCWLGESADTYMATTVTRCVCGGVSREAVQAVADELYYSPHPHCERACRALTAILFPDAPTEVSGPLRADVDEVVIALRDAGDVAVADLIDRLVGLLEMPYPWGVRR